jgi:DNA-binding CsgD family transcriptional regulator/uncharacterized protein HemY
VTTSEGDLVAVGSDALQRGRWGEARDAFERALAEGESAAARFGLATAAWWLGDNDTSVSECTRAYTRFRDEGDVAGAVQCAVWLGITYKANYANFAAANGWTERAGRLLEAVAPGPLHGWVDVTKAYRMADLVEAERLTRRALERSTDDVDLELTAISQLGLIKVGSGDVAGGFALIDEAMAAALAGEPASLGVVVYTSCDMLNACELAGDPERAAKWCQVADGFVTTYGCPFLYAECRIYYGSVLTAGGRWSDAERELRVGLETTARTCPGLHLRASTRLAELYIRQGRLEEAASLLSQLGIAAEAESDVALTAATLMLARGDAEGARRQLERHWSELANHRSRLTAALGLLLDAQLADGDTAAATDTCDRLATALDGVAVARLRAIERAARGRLELACANTIAARDALAEAARCWSLAEMPLESARAELDVARAVAGHDDHDAAVAHARHALRAFEELGATADADRAAAFLRSIGAYARTGAKGTGGLTDREREVMQLVGHGLSNPEIAARLHVSRKTAAHHVSSILTKLDMRNRAEIAAYAANAADPARH